MKFSKSAREQPLPLFTPPPNYYDPHTPPPKAVLTGTLAGPAPSREQPCFGQERRFKAGSNEVPGPGSYHKGSGRGGEGAGQRARVRQRRQQAFMGSESNSPSIPYHPFSQDEEDLEYAKQLQLREDLTRSSLSVKRRAEGYSFARSPRARQEREEGREEVPLESISEYSLQRQRGRVQMAEEVKKSTARRQELLARATPEFVPSLELIEIITRRRTKYNPGPGAYSRPPQQPEGPSFSTSKRFSDPARLQLGPGEYRVLPERKGSMSFSKSARTLFNLRGETDLEHRFYIDPLQGMRCNEALRQKSSPFGSQAARFGKLEREEGGGGVGEEVGARRGRLEAAVEKRLRRLEGRGKGASEGLLGISTMASTIE